jgi:hypothetical protein
MNYERENLLPQQHGRATHENEFSAAGLQRGGIQFRGHEVGAAMQSDTKVGQRAIPQAFGNLEKDLHALSERLNELNNRLRPISRPESPEVDKESKHTSSPIVDVPMVSEIAQADSSLRMSLRFLGGIIERLEV